MKQDVLDQQRYAEFLGTLKSSIRQRQHQALRAVNTVNTKNNQLCSHWRQKFPGLKTP